MTLLAELGPYFEVDVHERGAPPSAPWRPLRAMLDPDGLGERVDETRRVLTDSFDRVVEPRVATSITMLGIAARLVAPVLGLAVIEARLLDLDLDQVHWRADRGPLPLSLPALGQVRPRSDARLVDGIRDLLLNGAVGLLVDRTTDRSVSSRVAWGNVASALNGAAAVIVREQPALAHRAETITFGVLRTLSSDSLFTGTSTADFRRRSCCLLYRVAPDVRVCGDCVLHHPPRA